MAFERIYSNTKPILKSGTVLKLKNGDNDKYFICIQQPCDCVRIDKNGRQFLFSQMLRVERDKKFNFSFLSEDGDILYLQKDNKIYSMSLIKFIPDPENDIIIARNDSDKWVFTDSDKNVYELIFQLNEIHALRSIQENSNTLSRIGLMESEWQRRCAHSS